MMRGVRRSLVLLATGTIMAVAAAPAAAQSYPAPIVQPPAQDAGAELRRYLTTLGNNPQSLEALIGAGRAALRMGDADAALTFFGRADEVSPRNSRVKEGMGSALVQMGQAQAALSLFYDAVALGAPEWEIQSDRALAYDMMGDPRRAQQDYTALLRRRDDPEVRRRLALSLAISGNREAALAVIDAQLRRNDRAALRTQAFVLALTGDAAGAGRVATSAMPYGGAQQMAPFFSRLASLNPAQKALAVHLGHFPGVGRPVAPTARVDTSADPAAVALAMASAPQRSQAQAPPATRTADMRSSRSSNSRRRARERFDPSDPHGLRRERGSQTTERRRPPSAQSRQTADRTLAPPVQRPAQAQPPAQSAPQVAELETRWTGSPYQPQQQVQPAAPSLPPQYPAAPPLETQPQPPPSVDSSTVTSVSIPASTPPQTTSILATVPSTSEPAPTSQDVGQPAAPAPVEPSASPTSDLTAQPPSPEPASGSPSLADIAALVNELPQDPQSEASSPPQAAPPAPVQRSQAARETQSRAARSQATRPANPSRHWVQIAGGIDRASLPREFARLRAKAPDQLARRAAYTAPLRTTSRLLVGPFESAREAQDFVNQLARRNVSAFAWTSAAGQEIQRLAAR